MGCKPVDIVPLSSTLRHSTTKNKIFCSSVIIYVSYPEVAQLESTAILTRKILGQD